MVPLNYALQNGAAGRDHHGQAGRAVARLAQSGARLRAQPPRAHQGAAVVQGAAARGDGRAGTRDGRARARARSAQTALKLDAVAAKAGFAKIEEFFAAFARDEINCEAGADRDPRASRSRRRRARAPASRRSRHAAEPRRGLGQRHPRRRRRPPDDRPRALLQAGAAGSDRRLRHARQGRDDPSRDAAATSRACATREPERLIDAELGRAARRSVSRSTSWSRRWTARGCCATSPKILSREKINVTAVNTLTRNMHARMSVHARGAEPRAVEARAAAREGR